MASRLILLKSLTASSPRCFCTATLTATAVTENKQDTLFYKLSQLTRSNGPRPDLEETMNQWVANGKPIKMFDLVSCMKLFRSRKSYDLSLQLSKWMIGSDLKVNNAHRAKHIDFLAKIEGIESAENYFNTLEESAHTKSTYGSLLSCYCKEKNLDKALQLYEKMKELGFMSTLNYNNMIYLYLDINQPEKVPILVQEMEEKNIDLSIHTYNKLINSYAALKDLDAMEGVLEKMKSNNITCDWFTYGNLASMYINGGYFDKANEICKKMENMEDLNPEAFNSLILLYTRMSDLSGINRAWECLKSLKSKTKIPSNTSYLVMLLGLLKLEEFESLEKYFQEWEVNCVSYDDVRVSNVMLESYVSRNMSEEANLLYESVVKRGLEPNLRTFDIMTRCGIKNGDIDLGLKYLEMGVNKAWPEKRKWWFPSDETVKMFLEYFEEKKDLEKVKIFVDNMKKIERLESQVYDSLLL